MNSLTTHLPASSDTNSSPLCLEDLVKLYQGSLLQFAHSLTHCEADAWDLTQQTFLTFATKGHQLRDATKVKTWMFTTLHRTFLQICRRQTRFPHLGLDEVEAELPNIPPAELNHLDSSQVLQALEQVDHAYRAPLVLFYLEDEPYKEIARKLKLPMGTVKSRIARGIAQLRKIVAHTLSPEMMN